MTYLEAVQNIIADVWNKKYENSTCYIVQRDDELTYNQKFQIITSINYVDINMIAENYKERAADFVKHYMPGGYDADCSYITAHQTKEYIDVDTNAKPVEHTYYKPCEEWWDSYIGYTYISVEQDWPYTTYQALSSIDNVQLHINTDTANDIQRELES
jgi:hypothetical protein